VFGDIIATTRSWAIAQFTDDAGFAVPAQFMSPSWNYRSVFSALAGNFPLLTHSLASSNVQLSLVGGGAAYVRFGVSAGGTATVTATSANQAVPPNIDIILVRTK
jgi:hypothetical protein